MAASGPYDGHFFDALQEGSLQSARRIVPWVAELVSPRTVIDVGCGRGAWLSIFGESGCEILGVDGDYVDRARLLIPAERFLARDLARTVALDGRFDIAVSLEVAEHLPASRAESFVADLARLAPCVLFSAAIPLQIGTDHVNEQWPTYWAAHFARQGYVPIDCVRPRFWNDGEVDWWYAQNTLLFVERGRLERDPRLSAERDRCAGFPLDVVHPRRFTLDAELALALPRSIGEAKTLAMVLARRANKWLRALLAG